MEDENVVYNIDCRVVADRVQRLQGTDSVNRCEIRSRFDRRRSVCHNIGTYGTRPGGTDQKGGIRQCKI